MTLEALFAGVMLSGAALVFVGRRRPELKPIRIETNDNPRRR